MHMLQALYKNIINIENLVIIIQYKVKKIYTFDIIDMYNFQ